MPPVGSRQHISLNYITAANMFQCTSTADYCAGQRPGRRPVGTHYQRQRWGSLSINRHYRRLSGVYRRRLYCQLALYCPFSRVIRMEIPSAVDKRMRIMSRTTSARVHIVDVRHHCGFIPGCTRQHVRTICFTRGWQHFSCARWTCYYLEVAILTGHFPLTSMV